jgi:hypothetical protein
MNSNRPTIRQILAFALWTSIVWITRGHYDYHPDFRPKLSHWESYVGLVMAVVLVALYYAWLKISHERAIKAHLGFVLGVVVTVFGMLYITGVFDSNKLGYATLVVFVTLAMLVLTTWGFRSAPVVSEQEDTDQADAGLDVLHREEAEEGSDVRVIHAGDTAPPATLRTRTAQPTS